MNFQAAVELLRCEEFNLKADAKAIAIEEMLYIFPAFSVDFGMFIPFAHYYYNVYKVFAVQADFSVI